ncbi:hypothetical protein [Polymorphospora lycopeni]|uniref:Uncharacterized protein n=1 Tax=Polymorphospora lycopeni TaxID=3140240 RepID=A0ABV5CT91_9ACTN
MTIFDTNPGDPADRFLQHRDEAITVHGDAEQVLATPPTASVGAAVTSPLHDRLQTPWRQGPYGSETTRLHYVAGRTWVFGHVHRVLEITGTLRLVFGGLYRISSGDEPQNCSDLSYHSPDTARLPIKAPLGLSTPIAVPDDNSLAKIHNGRRTDLLPDHRAVDATTICGIGTRNAASGNRE